MKHLTIVLIVCGFFSCKKDSIQYTFEGLVIQNHNGVALNNVAISIYQKVFNSSVSNGNFALAGTTTTDASGNYNMSFDREKVTEFKINFMKNGFFSHDIILSSADVSTENNNKVDHTMDAKSWVQFDITNVLPSGSSDELQMIFYTYRKGCEQCIESDFHYLEGIIDSTLIYQNTGGEYLKFTYIVVGGQNTTDSVYMTPFDTAFYSINY